MALALQPIYTQTIGAGGASTVTFNNIPQSFTDLRLVISYRDAFSAAFLTPNMWFNGDNTSSSYSKTLIEAAGSGAVGSSRQTSATLFNIQNINGASSTANTFTSVEIYIPNYAGSSFKSALGDIVTENGATQSFQELHAFLWRNTSAIASVSIQPPQSFVQHSTFTLYGITKG
jgi:hypothetical protein